MSDHSKINGLRVYVHNSEVTRCLECERPISARSSYTFFCSKDCAADWADDEALMQTLERKKKAKP